MVESNEMRFYCSGVTAEPVGPKAIARMHGRPRRSYSLAEAEKETRWPALALVALHQATYPPTDGRDDPRLFEFAEAMFDPGVYEPLLYFADRLGTVPAHVFLRALLLDWDSGDDEGKHHTILHAFGVESCNAGSWSTAAAEAARAGEGGDHGT